MTMMASFITIDTIALRHYYHYHMNESMATISMRIKDLLGKERRMFFIHNIDDNDNWQYHCYYYYQNELSKSNTNKESNWREESKGTNTIREKRSIYSGIIIIRMVPIRLYIIHRTRHTILIATWYIIMKWLLHCHPCTKSSILTWYRHIEQSTESPN